MTMWPIAAALLIAAPAAAAPPLTAEEALENYQARFEPAGRPGCRTAQSTDEIVVCGRRESYRLPLPVDREPGTPIRGEPPSAAAMMSKCYMACPPAFGVTVVSIGRAGAGGAIPDIAGGIERLLGNDD
jgi:hypothetical protein